MAAGIKLGGPCGSIRLGDPYGFPQTLNQVGGPVPLPPNPLIRVRADTGSGD
jgi:hypothetical protein